MPQRPKTAVSVSAKTELSIGAKTELSFSAKTELQVGAETAVPKRASATVQVCAETVLQASAETVVPECLRGCLLVQGLQQWLRCQENKKKPSSGQEQELPSTENFLYKFVFNKKLTKFSFQIKLS